MTKHSGEQEHFLRMVEYMIDNGVFDESIEDIVGDECYIMRDGSCRPGSLPGAAESGCALGEERRTMGNPGPGFVWFSLS